MEKQFTKADLKTGQRVELRNGNIYIVLKDVETVWYEKQEILFACNNAFLVGSGFNDDLIRKDKQEQYDIIRVYDKPNDYEILDISKKGDLIWERAEVKEMTVEEASEKLGYKVKIVAKN